MKPLGQGERLGLASPLRYAAIQSGKTKSPSNREAGLDAIYQPESPRGGRRRIFFLDIPFHRMSVAGQVVENMFGAAEGWFGVNDPVLLAKLPEEVAECISPRQVAEVNYGTEVCPV
jgi:hypothetical protein